MEVELGHKFSVLHGELPATEEQSTVKARAGSVPRAAPLPPWPPTPHQGCEGLDEVHLIPRK